MEAFTREKGGDEEKFEDTLQKHNQWKQKMERKNQSQFPNFVLEKLCIL